MGKKVKELKPVNAWTLTNGGEIVGPDGWKKRTSGDIIMRPENYTKLVTDHGWKLIARRDQ